MGKADRSAGWSAARMRLGVKWSQVQILPSRPHNGGRGGSARSQPPTFRRSSHIAALLAVLAAPFAVAESIPASPLADLPAGAVKTWAGHRWRRVLQVPAVEVRVERRPAVAPPEDNIKSSALQPRVLGHARLFRRSDGSFRCEVQLAADSDDQALAHELAHCYGWRH